MALPLDTIPTPKSERWKYTNLPRVLKKLDLKPASLGWGRNVVILEPSAPGTAQYRDTDLWNLNTDHVSDIQFLSGDGEIDVVAKDGQWLSPRIVIDIKDNQNVTVIERQNGTGSYWKNTVVQIRIGNNTTLRHYRLFDEAEKGVSTVFTHVQIGRDSTYEAFSLIEGAGFIRNQTHGQLQGTNAHCWMNGINLLSGEQHADTTITIEHQQPYCTSKQTFKSVLTDKSHGVFQGKVHVHQIAQKTDGYQLSNALILSPQAEMDTKPELEIYADDVKCSHGATTGKLDEEPLFYMRARGIPEKQARGLLIQSFCAQALEGVSDEAMRETLAVKVEQWLSSRI
ncbi:MAG: Fe-S cluster assembly protein SufD [Micavibrio aeruginosavorus]|uniref:Fe-S cluster assembly protein SufD n=1 Tax=Micavibrio aeruginosavorus TaxID=349221 RepID=A0A2W5N2D2_9BACT|nr:MAG: Fe-S cluster assembly protein SufD [Micavibrio aeruginosavorus]